MAGLSSITVDSLGNRNSHGLPPLTDTPGTPADRETMFRVVEAWRRDPSGQTTDNTHQMAASFTAGVYIAINTIMTAMSGATVQVLRRERGAVAKSATANATGSAESEWSPVDPDHEIARLFADPNTRDTTSDFLAEYVLCRSLFGLGAILWNPGRGTGRPADLWNLRRNWMSAHGGMSLDYPRGHVWYNTPMPSLWGVGGAGTGLRIPRERLVLHRRHHPLFPWDAYSPLSGGGKLVDFLNSVIDSRQMAMDRGLSLDAIINLKGVGEPELKLLDAKIREKYTGSNRGQRFMTANGDDIQVNLLGTSPDKMAYTDSYTQGVAAVLAVFRVPAVCAFLADSDYSGWYAAARAWREGDIGGETNSIGQRWTKDLIRPHWGPDYRVEIKLPPLMDPEQKERQWQLLNNASGVAYKLRELRASLDMPPMEGDDLTPDEAKARLQQKAQPQPPGGVGTDPIAALLGGDPNAEPGAPGELDTPDVGAAGEGSLPGKVDKGLGAYFDRLVAEVCA